MKVFQKGFHYGQDGQGNRLVIHMQGCNLRCPWCANPEGLNPSGAAMRHGEGEPPQLSCQEISVHELVRLCEESKLLFFDGGGVTFTGGEPTLQIEALTEALVALRQAEIHTAIETNGTFEGLPELFPLIDQLIMDFKTADPARHATLGSGFEVVVKNLSAALQQHGDVLIRIPLVDGFNTSEADLAAFLAAIGPGPRPNASFEFLRFHEFGKEKWRQWGMAYNQDPAYVKPEDAARFQQAFADRGLRVTHT